MLHGPGRIIGYKWLSKDAGYSPCSPYPSIARFGDGTIRTIYVAETTRGAMAEFFRRAPELIDFQDDLQIVLHELDVDITGECLDVLEAASRGTVGISLGLLTSSDVDEVARYLECRELAREVVMEGLTGIFFPSAAATWSPAWNLVLFAEQTPVPWTCLNHREVAPPRLAAADVRSLAFT